MTRFTMMPAFVPDDVNDYRVVEDGAHNAWAVFDGGEIKYAFEFEDSSEEIAQRKNAERMLSWCQRREALYGAR